MLFDIGKLCHSTSQRALIHLLLFPIDGLAASLSTTEPVQTVIGVVVAQLSKNEVGVMLRVRP